MNDVFLAEKISDAVIHLCGERNIGLLEDLIIAVDQNCRVSAEQLATLIKDKKPALVDADTRIRFIYDLPGFNTAEIRTLCGSEAISTNAGD